MWNKETKVTVTVDQDTNNTILGVAGIIGTVGLSFVGGRMINTVVHEAGETLRCMSFNRNQRKVAEMRARIDAKKAE